MPNGITLVRGENPAFTRSRSSYSSVVVGSWIYDPRMMRPLSLHYQATWAGDGTGKSEWIN